ncbi:MAG: hypothetical protein AAF720_05125 [Pseudomonadota bacterium]
MQLCVTKTVKKGIGPVKRAKGSYILGLFVFVCLCSIGIFVISKQNKLTSNDEAPRSISSASEVLARRKVQYVNEPTPETASAFAFALLNAQQYDDLSQLLDDVEAPFATEKTRRSFRAKAALQQGVYSQVFLHTKSLRSNVDLPTNDTITARQRARLREAEGFNAFADFLEAKALYAYDTRKADEVVRLLEAPIRRGGTLGADAWLLRARIALDAADFRGADLALRRARDADARQTKVNALKIEQKIRQGFLSEARNDIQILIGNDIGVTRSNNKGQIANPEILRLSGLLALHEERFRDAARAFQSIGKRITSIPRGRLLIAISHLGAGDNASAAHAVAAHLAEAPNDWVGFDILLHIASRSGDRVKFESVSSTLRDLNPGLTAIRTAVSAKDPESFFNALASFASEDGARQSSFALLSAQTLLIGRDIIRAPLIPQIAQRDLQRATLLSSAGVDFDPSLQNKIEDLFARHSTDPSAQSSPALRALGGLTYEVAGKFKKARTEYLNSLREAPNFTPALLRFAALSQSEEDLQLSIEILTDHVNATPELSLDKEMQVRRALSKSHTLLGQPGEAIDVLEPVKEHLKKNSNYALDYATLLANTGNSKRLKEFADDTASRLPSGVAKAQLFELAGNAERAALAFRSVLSADPLNDTATQGYRKAMTALGREREAEALILYIAQRYGSKETPATSRSLSQTSR